MHSNKLKNFIKYGFVIVAIAFMAYYLGKNWSALKNYEWHFNIASLLISMFLLWLGIAISIVLFTLIFRWLLKVDIKFCQVFKMYNITNIGRYIPGKFWSVMGVFYFTNKMGISKKQTMMAIIINEISSKGSALLIGLGYFFFSSHYSKFMLPMAGLLALALIVLHPRILGWLVNLILKILRKELITIDIGYFKIISVFILYASVWLFCGLGFFFMVSSFTNIQVNNLYKFITIFPFSIVVGYIALFSPGGIGIREGIITAMLAEFISADIAFAAALLQRIWFLMVEALNFGISVLMPIRFKQ